MFLPISEAVLSEFARSKFARHGRGAVVIDEGGAVQTVAGERHGVALGYLFEGSELFAQVGRRWPGRTKVAVETYDPVREMVVIRLDREGELEAFLLPLA